MENKKKYILEIIWIWTFPQYLSLLLPHPDIIPTCQEPKGKLKIIKIGNVKRQNSKRARVHFGGHRDQILGKV